MPEVVLDASALLALLHAEPGRERVAACLPGARLSAVNLAEVVGKLAEHGLSEAEIRGALGGLGLVVVPFEWEHALACGLLRPATRVLGLSLGDRAALGLARALGLPILSADRAWGELPAEWGVELIR
jgi:PIN domain nuclease of toxin-antitoxin system